MNSKCALRAVAVDSLLASSSEAARAFQFMAQAKHIGKIALTLRPLDVPIVARSPFDPVAIRNDRRYLITGGLGGLGLSLAKSLVDQGARSLVLVGRSAPNADAIQTIQSITAMGAVVETLQVDLACEIDVQQLVSTMAKTLPPLGGVVHAAAVLDDHLLLDQSNETFQRVFAPKAIGAWNLHRYLGTMDLDFFVLYSSAASLLGSPGQANYCAANAFLDALARERVRRHLPGMSIQWGAFSDVGLAARAQNRSQSSAIRGVASMTPIEGERAFHRLLKHPRAEVGVLRFDIRQWIESYPSMAQKTYYRELLANAASDRLPNAQQRPKLRVELEQVDSEQRVALIEEFLLRETSRVLQQDPSKIKRDMSFHHLGVDSLMRLELRNRIRAGVDFEPSIAALSRCDNILELAKYLLQQIALAQVVVETRNGGEDDAASAEEMETMTF